MLANGLFLIAVAAVLATPLGHDSAWLIILPLLQAAVCWLTDHGLRYWPGRLAALPVAGSLIVAALLAMVAVDLPLYMTCYLVGAMAMLVLLAARARLALLFLAINGPGLLAICLPLLDNGPAMSSGRTAMLTWSLAGWPLMVYQCKDRDWPLYLLTGLIGASMLSVEVLIAATATRPDYVEIMLGIWTYGDSALALGQTMLVILSIAPLMAYSEHRWRMLTAIGIAAALGPFGAALITGPWTGGYPAVVWWCGIPGGLVVAIGIIGMLCTVQRGDLLGRAAHRAMALGVGATAVLLLRIKPEDAQGAAFISAMAAALSPLAWALLMAILLAIAQAIADKRQAAWIGTEALERSQLRLSGAMRSGISQIAHRFHSTIRQDAGSWLHAQGLVPAILVIAVLIVLPTEMHLLAVPCLVICAVPYRSLARASTPAFIIFHGLLMAVAVLLMGGALHAILAVIALSMPLLWPFSRWPDWNQGWALPAGLLLMAIAWPYLAINPAIDQAEVVMIAALGALIANLLLPGTARRWVLIANAVWLATWLVWWVQIRDPFTATEFRRIELLPELLSMILRFPFVAMALSALWVCRARYRQGQGLGSWPVLLGLVIPGAIAALLWLFGWHRHWGAGLTCWALLAIQTPLIIRQLRASPHSTNAAPIIDALSMVVVVLVMVLADCLSTAIAHGSMEAGAITKANSLGEILVDGARDLAAAVAACAVVIGFRRVVETREEIIHAFTQAIGATVTISRNRADNIKGWGGRLQTLLKRKHDEPDTDQVA